MLMPISGFAQNDTIYFDPSGNRKQIDWRHEYDKVLTMKLILSQSGYDGKLKRRDNGKSEVFMDFEGALEVIKKIDNLTLGIPKIIYLVGWQYNGHDSKYPAFFEANAALKRKEDDNALESLEWLMGEARKYHTTISLHINMFDAYVDSPLWDIYVANDIIARNIDGTLREGEWGYPISYAQEWKTGFAQKRIDSLLRILPIAQAGTIHIDAFHTWAPIGGEGPGKAPFIKGPVSPYLGFSVSEESEAQRKIIDYWGANGVDVTSEGATFLREDTFEGYQPMAWWVDWGLQEYMKWPASYYTGGVDRGDNGKLFGTSMHGEDLIRKDPENLTGFKNRFCTTTAVWYFLNQFERQKYIEDKKGKKMFFSDGVVSSISDNGYTIVKDGNTLVHDNDVFIPALWMEGEHIIAYSMEGYQGKKWLLPKSWSKFSRADLLEITINGQNKLGTVKIVKGQIDISLKADQMILIRPHRPEPHK